MGFGTNAPQELNRGPGTERSTGKRTNMALLPSMRVLCKGRFVRSAQDPNGPEPETSAPYFNRGRNISAVLAALFVTYRFILLLIPIDGL